MTWLKFWHWERYAVYCEADQIIAPYPCDIARFLTIFVYSDIVDFSNVGNVKNQLLRAFSFRQRTKMRI